MRKAATDENFIKKDHDSATLVEIVREGVAIRRLLDLIQAIDLVYCQILSS